MNRIKNSLIAFGGLSLLIGAIAFATPRATQGQGGTPKPPADVNVVNTPTVNVGNTPSVNIANSPTVNLASGASVGINPLSNTVRLHNTTASPLPVFDANDGRQPFQSSASSIQEGTNVSMVTVATVPAGKRLVIEFVSATGQLPPGQHVAAWQITTIAPPTGGATHDLLVNEQPPFVNGDALFRTSQQVRLYANSGSTVGDVRVGFSRSSSVGIGQFHVTISGYLVDVP
jgi:hypothetical protein